MTPAPADAQPVAKYIAAIESVRSSGKWSAHVTPEYRGGVMDGFNMAIIALQSVDHGWAPAAPAQDAPADAQPVAWQYRTQSGEWSDLVYLRNPRLSDIETRPLYAHPPAAPAQDVGDIDRMVAILRSRDLELPEFHAMQLPLADELTRLRAALDQARADTKSAGQATDDYRERYNKERIANDNLRKDLDAANARAEANAKALADANSMCRSAYQVCNAIATQVGTVVCDRRIGALADRLHESLERQRAVMYPDAAKGTTP